MIKDSYSSFERYREIMNTELGENVDIEEMYSILIKRREAIEKILDNYDLNNITLEWTWPKGRMNVSLGETGFLCACREFEEEVGITLPPSIFVSSTYITESFKNLSGTTIETRCWVYIIPNEVELERYPKDHTEVSERMWMTVGDVVKNKGKSKLTGMLDTLTNSTTIVQS